MALTGCASAYLSNAWKLRQYSNLFDFSPVQFVPFCLLLKVTSTSSFFATQFNMDTAPLISAAVLAAGAYVNAKYSIVNDLKQLESSRAFRNRMGRRIQELGDTCTLYGMFDLVDPSIEALWFEGRTWTYGELKRGKCQVLFR